MILPPPPSPATPLHGLSVTLQAMINPNFVILILGFYHHYDKFVYPMKTKVAKHWYEKGLAELVKETGGMLGQMIGLSTPKQPLQDHFTPMKELEMGKMCLMVYLSDLKQLLCGNNFQHGFDVAVTVEEIVHIFCCVARPCISYQGARGNVIRPDLHLEEVGHYFCVDTC